MSSGIRIRVKGSFTKYFAMDELSSGVVDNKVERPIIRKSTIMIIIIIIYSDFSYIEIFYGRARNTLLH